MATSRGNDKLYENRLANRSVDMLFQCTYKNKTRIKTVDSVLNKYKKFLYYKINIKKPLLAKEIQWYYKIGKKAKNRSANYQL